MEPFARRVMPLGPGTPLEEHRAAIAAATVSRACRAGLYLLYDFLDESHAISQELPTPEGSFWHAVMHRREPDAFNSKYWFAKVGPHRVFASLVAEGPSLGYAYTSPAAFVDFCERVRGSGSAEEELAMRVQTREWELLFEYCREYEAAVRG